MKRILLSGGGTGGHIYPALAIARAVRKKFPDVEIAYIGTSEGLESRIVPKEGNIHFYTVEIQGFKRSVSWENVHTLHKFIKAVRKSKEYMREFEPDVVVGTGGYVSGPAVYAAHQLGIPTLIHEQNVVLGLTTKFLSRFVDVVAISLEESQKYLSRANRIVFTGNPRATEVVQANAANGRKSLGITDAHKPIILIFGGSRGAKAINEAVLEMIPRMKEMPDVHFVYVTGEVHYDKIREMVQTDDIPNLDIKPFIYNMPDVLAATYLVVGRAGASTLAELTALGLPSILIPSPYVTNNHQEANARWLEEQGASKMLLESECTGQNLWREVKRLIENKEEHHAMSEAASRLGRPHAAEVLVSELEKIAVTHD
ncbi:undecaprenyldiphospho-muramoylpentapeptide beta-N-acetylglucosaminyltransferase [Thermoactinomyces intermedius]|jgi:UDP-N-acetylglucosamine--N-acetylmuramyl-(pentapeptide) pyrophosphoryl-undecaprenol N-acetylglucosamine transferase|uniref:UDP-N-acetylglucosamine--N-acetylmuramyl-(pentapeptide) pyrophosphoryl-undecaprenol N-acetylglucosamine transferase n=1 Tax=Thermoactinomyces intermedius TaxID=2024 RepID=A0A8I1A7I2_THEIN|nr:MULTISPECIES: undecaprenyldiphospho-muramoylpentapeptide beta-N-acetylglucosaminyltransferase [Thermoactinomyces]MBA4547556.1 undecaprenyldiphospho-muramoylpentapeptide beta-N-acetylglucosaminyltransferase [Thermoactinomyces intermedius]MBA4836196.1 undecaprenyldiphospho-muramoylpentapeptide beta-N-acetylglucosaminyltransferase [Thermoactinomyces intermedius]MBH8594215.1 undecaprenyldiphospho-muramoylpentapeptide beta-N-acetylglucosaminyltransferase [Thermoactinomyces intermedius]MBH8601051.